MRTAADVLVGLRLRSKSGPRDATLKFQLSAKLNHARSNPRYTAADRAVCSRIQIGIHGLWIRIVMIEQIEELRAKLERPFLADPERFVRRKIKIPNPRQAERVRSWRSSILPELRLYE